MALGCPVEANGDAVPVLQPVDQVFDGVAFFVEVGVVADGPPAPAASFLAVGGLVLLLRNDCLDVVFAQVGAVGAGRVDLVRGDRTRPGAGPADRQADANLVQYGDELRAVRGLLGGQGERQRPATRWILPVSPPRDRSSRACFRRSRCRRRTRRRSSRSGPFPSCCCPSLSCLRVTTAFLPGLPGRRTQIGRIDHNITQALGRRVVHPAVLAVRLPQPQHPLRARSLQLPGFSASSLPCVLCPASGSSACPRRTQR